MAIMMSKRKAKAEMETMLDISSSWALPAAAAAAAIIFVSIIIDGFKRLAGAQKPLLRRRKPGQSDFEYLVGPVMAKRTKHGLEGWKVHIQGSAAEPDEWECNVPPPLAAGGSSHLYLPSALSHWIFRDTVIRPKPVEIHAPVALVWRTWLDFEAYGGWNGFHRQMEIVDKPAGVVGLRMTVDLGPLLGRVVETSNIYYVDTERHIFIYGLRGDEAASSMRVVWLEERTPNLTVFHSYDTIGGWPALLCRGHIEAKVLDGFNEQHLAIRDRCDALQRAAAAEAAAPARAISPPLPEAFGVCLVTGGSGFLGSHLVRMLSSLDGTSHVHVIDLQPPRAAANLPPNATFHQCSLTDDDALARIYAAVRPASVFHVASLIDLRPGRASKAANLAVNVGGTARLLELAKTHGTSRFVYTSTIEAAYHSNSCVHAEELTVPFPPHPENHYQATKIAAERLVLAANRPGQLHTVAIRPAHIFGHGDEDFLVGYMRDVCVNFSADVYAVGSAARGAPMSMVHVENCALAHVLAAAQAGRADVYGRAYYAQDFDENIIQVYRALAGRGPAAACLPYWLLWVLVHLAIGLHLLVLAISGGRIAVLGPMRGLHHGALAAALPCTVCSTRARAVLGYDCGYAGHVSRSAAIASAQGPPRPLVSAKIVRDAISRACARDGLAMDEVQPRGR
jgi:nucleoside-diphosphate-sugar epimerase